MRTSQQGKEGATGKSRISAGGDFSSEWPWEGTWERQDRGAGGKGAFSSWGELVQRVRGSWRVLEKGPNSPVSGGNRGKGGERDRLKLPQRDTAGAFGRRVYSLGGEGEGESGR